MIATVTQTRMFSPDSGCQILAPWTRLWVVALILFSPAIVHAEQTTGCSLEDSIPIQQVRPSEPDRTIAGSDDNSLGFARQLNHAGNTALERGDLKKAKSYLERALSIRQRLAPGSRDWARTLISLGDLARRRGEITRQQDYFQQALQAGDALESADRADILDGLGSACIQLVCAQKAQDLLDQALQIRQQVQPESLALASTLSYLGRNANSRGDPQQAEKDFTQALELRRRLAPGSLAVAASLNDLGVNARSRGDLAEAEQCLRAGLQIRRRLVPNSLAVADSLHNLGILFWMRDDLSEAQEYLGQTLRLRRKLVPGSPQLAQSLIWQGLLCIRRQELADAHEYFVQALEVLEKELSPDSLAVASVLNNLGSVARSRGDLTLSQGYYRKALAIEARQAPDSPVEANSLQALGNLARQRGDLAEAESYFGRALAIDERKIPDSSAHAGVLFALASLRRQERKREEAEGLYERAVEVLEKQTSSLGGTPEERSIFRARYEWFYQDYIDLLIALQRQPDVALRVLERARAWALVEMLARAQVSVSGEGVKHPPTLTGQQVQALLDDDTLLLEYSLGAGASYVWAVTRTTLEVHRLPSRRIIEQSALRMRDLMTTRGLRIDPTDVGWPKRISLADKQYPAAARELSGLVLGPVAGLLTNKRIVIVSDGALQYVPFAALPAPAGRAPGNSSPVGDTPLVAQHEITNLPSASVLAELRQEAVQRRPAPKAVAVLADPVFDREDERIVADPKPRSATGALVDRLLWTRVEADQIMKVTPAGAGLLALDFEASRATALSPQLSQYRIVHFATHAISDEEHPERSGLMLSSFDRQGRRQNGFLGLQQIYGLKLPADLVVLSACETALGRDIEGEGLVGLVRGFMYAGATRVMASLWNVEDEVTAYLMAQFYRSLEQDGLSPAAALQAAQTAVRKHNQWSAPYYWAGFQLEGEWR